MFLRLSKCGRTQEDEEKRLQIVVSMIRRKATTGSVRVKKNSSTNGPVLSPQLQTPTHPPKPGAPGTSNAVLNVTSNELSNAIAGNSNHANSPSHLKPESCLSPQNCVQVKLSLL